MKHYAMIFFLHIILANFFRYTDYRDTVLSLMADVSRLKFQGVIPGAPTGGQSPNVEKSNSQCGSAKKDPLQSTEKVLVTPL